MSVIINPIPHSLWFSVDIADLKHQVNRILSRPVNQYLMRVVYSPVTLYIGQPFTSGTCLAIPLSVIQDTNVGVLRLSCTIDPSRVTTTTTVLPSSFRDVSLEWHIEDGILKPTACRLEGRTTTPGSEGVQILLTVPDGKVLS